MLEPATTTLPPDPGRRRLLAAAALLGGAGLLPRRLAAEEAGEAARRVGLDEFMTLSRLLTGATDLSRELGGIYLDSIGEGSEADAGLAALWAAAGSRDTAPHGGVRQPAGAGVFGRADLDEAAAAVLEFWYTGIYGTGNGPKVAEYTDTLAWRAVGYTTAPSDCGGPTGFWADPPPDARDAATSPG